MRQLLFGGLAALLLTGAAQAQTVLNIKDGNGSPQTLLGHNGGGANLWLNQSFCDPNTPNLCAFVNSNNALKVFMDPATVATVNIGTIGGAASAANQAALMGSVAPGAAATASQLTGCQYNSTSPTPSPGQQLATQCDHSGFILVDIGQVTGIIQGTPTAGATGSLIMGTILSGPAAFSPGTNQMLGMNPNGDLRADHMVTGGNAGAPTMAHICQNHITVNPSTATDTNLVSAVAGKSVYVCDEAISTSGADTLYLESNTTGSCGGTLAQMDTAWYMPANGAKTDANPFWRGLVTAVGSGVCVKTSAATPASFTLYYDQY